MDQKREQIAVLLNDLYEDTGFKRDFILGAKSIEELQGITEEQLSLAWEVIDRRVDIMLEPKGYHDAYPNETD